MEDDARQLFAISDDDWRQTPESVRLAVQSLLDIVRVQSAQIHALQTEVRELQAKVGQSSRNSSRPPSSDPPSLPPPPPRPARGRKAGGQPGHAGHHRPLVPPDQVDEIRSLCPEQCPVCTRRLPHGLPHATPPRRTQVWELPPLAPHITEYQQHTVCCPHCRAHVTADLPPDAPPGALGPRLTAFVGVLRGRYRLSERDVVAFLSDVWGIAISTQSVLRSCERVSAALAPVDAAIQAAVQAQPSVNVDETSWPDGSRRAWLWTATSSQATCFRIQRSRGRPALQALIGEGYRGIVGSDRLTTYNQVPDRQRQLCWAHLARNLVALDERYANETVWAREMLRMVDDLFFVWHAYMDGWYDRIALQQALMPIRHTMHDQVAMGQVSRWPKIVAFSGELLTHWDALWTFSRVAGVEPTNNAAERALRPAVLWRKGCFGSRSRMGCQFVERILSVRATCASQGRALFAFLTQAVHAAWAGAAAPVLLPPP